jgi:hypothetical protein
LHFVVANNATLLKDPLQHKQLSAVHIEKSWVIGNLVFAFELALHALDSRHFSILYALSLEHLREGTLALLGNQAVL